MKSKLSKKLLIWCGVLLLIYLVLGVVLRSYMFSYLSWKESEIVTLHSLQDQLDLPKSDFSIPATFWEVPQMISTANLWKEQVALVPILQAQVAQIENKFAIEVGAYINSIEQYAPSEAVFTQLNLNLENFENVGFEEKRNSDQFMSKLKSEFRQYLTNKNSEDNSQTSRLRYQLDAQAQLSEMTLFEKIWQLIVPTISSTTLTSREAELLKAYKPGGVVLLGTNVASSEQVKQLTNSLQQTNPIEPLFIMTDQEGGLVKRVWWDTVPGQKQMSGFNLEQQCNLYSNRDNLLAQLGINFNLGIVADVTSDSASFIFPRVFSGDFSKSAEQSENALKCSKQTINTLKHFPGHGATTADTHLGLATINLDKAEWEKSHLLPFATVSSLSQAEMNMSAVMTGHLILNALDTENPTSLSPTVIGYLREQLGYSGLVITDDMRMLDNAGKDRKQAAKQAILAGNDILLYSLPLAEVVDIAAYLKQQVEQGAIPEEVINKAVVNILESKDSLIQQADTYVPLELVW